MASSNLRLIKKLQNRSLVRCKYWIVCDAEECFHHPPHNPKSKEGTKCLWLSPVKYCRKARGFVHDIPLDEIDSNLQLDPNLAFKARRSGEGKLKTTLEEIMGDD